MINTSNYTSKDNPSWLPVQPVRTAAATGAPARTAARGRPPGSRGGHAGRIGYAGGGLAALATTGIALFNWLAAIPRRLGDRLFAVNDTEARWWRWQITKAHGGLARRYRDLQFDTLAECPECRGSGGTTHLPCPPCLGTGRITRREPA